MRIDGNIKTSVYMILNHVHDTLFTFLYTCLLNNSKRKNTNEFSQQTLDNAEYVRARSFSNRNHFSSFRCSIVFSVCLSFFFFPFKTGTRLYISLTDGCSYDGYGDYQSKGFLSDIFGSFSSKKNNCGPSNISLS